MFVTLFVCFLFTHTYCSFVTVGRNSLTAIHRAISLKNYKCLAKVRDVSQLYRSSLHVVETVFKAQMNAEC